MSNNTEQEQLLLCDCHICMRGGRREPKPVQRRTYNNHAPYRQHVGSYAEYLSQQPHIQPPGMTASHPNSTPQAVAGSSRRSESPHREGSDELDRHRNKRVRLQAEQREDSESDEGLGQEGVEEGNGLGVGDGEFEEEMRIGYRADSPSFDQIEPLQFDEDENV
ncbi:hypothetical protein BDZ97DRAFT_1753025 [Flammula alnicola]|nr:hypothetical protein BDZ97DRAFT_1753025 [Flammula alnicola]